MNQRRVSNETPTFSQFQRAEGLYGKTQLKLVALDHCGAEITVELHPLARDTKSTRDTNAHTHAQCTHAHSYLYYN